MRYGAEDPRTKPSALAFDRKPSTAAAGAFRGRPQAADSIGFGVVFPYMGLRRPSHVRKLRPHAKPLRLDICSRFLMTSASELRSGKGHRDENFPVASWIIHPRHRALILAFYNFVRTADDIADHATLVERDKLNYLDLLEAAAPCPRRPDRISYGCDQASIRKLGRSDSLLPILGHAGRTVHARRPRRKHIDLAGLGRALRRPANQQSSAGLRQGLSGPQSGLSSARCAGGSGGFRRGARTEAGIGAAAAMPAFACGADRDPARRKQAAQRRGAGFSARARNLRDPGFRRQDRPSFEGARSPEPDRASRPR